MRFLDLQGKSQKEQWVEILGFIHYIMAAVGLLVSVLVIPFVFFAAFMPLIAAGDPEAAAPLSCAGGMMVVVGILAILISLSSAALTAAVGWCLQNRRGYYFVVVIACLNLLSVPLGTALGVATLVLVFDPEIQPQFKASGSAAPATPAA